MATLDWHPMEQRRLELGLTVGQCAEALRIDRGTWYNWISGKRQPSALKVVDYQAFLDGTKVPTQAEDGTWHLVPASDAPAPGPRAQKPRTLLDEARAHAAEVGEELPPEPTWAIIRTDDGGMLIQVSMGGGLVYEERRDAAGVVVERRKGAPAESFHARPVEKPGDKAPPYVGSGAVDPSKTALPLEKSAPRGLTEPKAEPRLADMLHRIIAQKTEPIAAEGGIRPVGVELTPQLHDYLRAEAKRLNLGQSAFVRWLLRAYKELAANE